LANVTIGDSLTSIGTYMFCNTALTEFVIPASVTSIGDNAFYDYVKLTSITLPDKVTFIGNGSFSYCVNLTSITLGKAVNSIGNYEFSHCYALTSITFTGLAKPAYVGAEWIFYTPDNITGHAYAESNFNKTGEYYNDLLMGPAFVASTNGHGIENDNTLLIMAIISVVAIVLLIGLVQLEQQKKKNVRPNLPPVQRIQSGPALYHNPPTGLGVTAYVPVVQFCPNCGNSAGEGNFCIKCGFRVK
jgi:hypothetical protein